MKQLSQVYFDECQSLLSSLHKLSHAINRYIFLALKIESFQLKNFDIFLIFAQNIDCGYRLAEAVLTSTHNLCFGAKIRTVGILLHSPVLLKYSCRDALSVRAFARRAWLRVGDYLYSRVTSESLANFAQSCAIIWQTRKTICQTRAT